MVTSLFVFLIIYLLWEWYITEAQLSGAQLSTFSCWTIGPRGPTVRGPTVYNLGRTVGPQGPTVHFFATDNWALDNWAPGPKCLLFLGRTVG